MRHLLKDRVGKRGRFCAAFGHRSSRSNQFGTVATAIFFDVRDEAGTQVTDHAWFLWSRQMDALKLKPGDRVTFYATVATYTKDDPTVGDWDVREWGPRPRITDYRLSHHSNMRLVNGGEPESLGPLFDSTSEAARVL
jgi:hypothetical protein